MLNWISHPEDFWSGVLFLAVTAAFLWVGWDLQTGTAARMGPGYFPRGVASVLGIVGLVLICRGFSRTGRPLGHWTLRGIVTLLGSLLLFGLIIRSAGLVVTGLLTMLISSIAAPDGRWLETILVSVVVVAACTLLFVFGIGLAIPVWPSFLR